MTLQELGDKEEALYRKVIDLYRQPQSDQTDMMLQGIFLEYRKDMRRMLIYRQLTLRL
jgi:hypothetical protein